MTQATKELPGHRAVYNATSNSDDAIPEAPLAFVPDGASRDAQVARERRRADAANARAERERKLARQATERALAAERRLAAHEASAAWRITWPIRRLAHAVPRPVYSFVRGLPVRLRDAKAGGLSRASPALPDHAEPQPLVRSGPQSGPWALLIDDQWPRADRDAGSVEIVNMAAALIAFGFQVQFAISWGQPGAQPGDPEGHAALSALGVRCLGSGDALSLDAFLEREGARFALVVLNRVYCGGRFMEAVRSHCTGARVVFNTIDLHYLRLRREAELSVDVAGRAFADTTRQREEGLAREADATIVVSEAEAAELARAVPGATIVVLPLARPVQPPQASFEARSGIGFIGGFAHAPNLDAIRFFLDEVWPLVLRVDPEFRFSIVGAGLPPGTLDGVPGRIEYLGAIPDAGLWFETLRLTIAPLRFGAGVKGKVVSSLAAGVPCVATPMATEGMGLCGGDGVLKASSPTDLAQAILQIHSDAELWSALSAAGLAQIAARFSPDAWHKTLADALWTLDVLPPASVAG